jgi:hypothetical protein
MLKTEQLDDYDNVVYKFKKFVLTEKTNRVILNKRRNKYIKISQTHIVKLLNMMLYSDHMQSKY